MNMSQNHNKSQTQSIREDGLLLLLAFFLHLISSHVIPSQCLYWVPWMHWNCIWCTWMKMRTVRKIASVTWHLQERWRRRRRIRVTFFNAAQNDGTRDNITRAINLDRMDRNVCTECTRMAIHSLISFLGGRRGGQWSRGGAVEIV